MAKCCAPGCNNYDTVTSRENGISFHHFPFSRADILEQWLGSMGREAPEGKTWVPSKTSKLCSEHFTYDCLERSGQTNRLKEWAVPTIFHLPQQNADNSEQEPNGMSSEEHSIMGVDEKPRIVRRMGDYFDVENSSNPSEAQVLPGTWTIEINHGTRERDGQSVNWHYNSTMLLIESVRARLDEFVAPDIKKVSVWKKVAKDLAARGYSYNGEQCDKKWRALKFRYKNITEKKLRAGGGNPSRKKWEFFDLMDEVMGGDPTLAPPPDPVSSRNGVKVMDDSAAETETPHDDPSSPPSLRKSLRISTNVPPKTASKRALDPPETTAAKRRRDSPTTSKNRRDPSPAASSDEESSPEDSPSRRRGRGGQGGESDGIQGAAPRWFKTFARKQLKLMNEMKESMDRRNELLERLVEGVCGSNWRLI